MPSPARAGSAAAVIFDLDGVLLESEGLWDDVRRRLAEEWGGRWSDGAQRRMMGMNTEEWTAFMARDLGLSASPSEIEVAVVERLARELMRTIGALETALGESEGTGLDEVVLAGGSAHLHRLDEYLA
ncbi:MAG: hypothetical protein ACR2N6_05585, partial [Miltoncostaeaceae bacterium]